MTQLGLLVVALVCFVVLVMKHRTSSKQPAVEPPVVEFDYEKVPIPSRGQVDFTKVTPHPYRPWKSGKFVMTMGIRVTPQEEWFDFDDQYWPEQQLRRDLLKNHHDEVTQTLPGSEEACAEALEMIVSYLTRRFPHLFYHPQGKEDYIHNAMTDMTFRIKAPYDIKPIEVAAQLVMEDLNIMMMGAGPDPEQHYLRASFSMAPAGWYLRERIGWPLYKIHTPVPLWEEKLRKSVEKAFTRMKPTDLIGRHNFFIQTDDNIFQQEPFLAERADPPPVEDIRIRHERQTLRRLPKSKAILFTVRTYMTRLQELEDDPESIRELLGAIKEMHPAMARYKGRQVWGRTVQEWGAVQLERHEAQANSETSLG